MNQGLQAARHGQNMDGQFPRPRRRSDMGKGLGGTILRPCTAALVCLEAMALGIRVRDAGPTLTAFLRSHDLCRRDRRGFLKITDRGRRLVSSKDGVTSLETALLMALVGVSCIAGVTLIGVALSSLFAGVP